MKSVENHDSAGRICKKVMENFVSVSPQYQQDYFETSEISSVVYE